MRLEARCDSRKAADGAGGTSAGNFGECLDEENSHAWEIRWAALGEGPEGRGACGHDRLAKSREVSVMWERRRTRRFSRHQATGTVTCGMRITPGAQRC